MKSSLSTISQQLNLSEKETQIIGLFEEYLKDCIHKNRGFRIKVPELGSFKFVFSNLSKCIKKIYVAYLKSKGLKDGRYGKAQEIQEEWLKYLLRNFNQAKQFRETIGIDDKLFFKLHLVEYNNYKKLEELFSEHLDYSESSESLESSEYTEPINYKKSGRLCILGITPEDIEFIRSLKEVLPDMSEYIDNTIRLIYTQYRIVFFGNNSNSYRHEFSKDLKLPQFILNLKTYENIAD